MRRLVVTFVVVALCCVLGSAAGAAKTPWQHVTIFTDSVGGALSWDSTAKRIIERRNRVLFELHPCGRLVQPGCISPAPPSVLKDVRRLGHRIGPNVIVFVGYNDDPKTYREGIPTVLKAMRNRGVKHVLWLTLRALDKQYVDINHAIYAADQKWRPLLTVLDWNRYSAPHTAWYASDRIHLSGVGAVAFATYLHQSLKKMGLTGLPPALRG